MRLVTQILNSNINITDIDQYNGKILVFNLGDLVTHSEHQRTIEPDKLDRLDREWDEDLYEIPIIGFVKEHELFHVAEGQHRTIVRKRKGYLTTEGKLIVFNTYKEFRAYVKKVNGKNKSLWSSNNHYWLDRPDTPEANKFEKATSEQGFRIVQKLDNKGRNELTNAASLFSIYNTYGQGVYIEALRFINACWSKQVLKAPVVTIEACCLFIRDCSKLPSRQWNFDRVVKVVEKHPLNIILKGARKHSSTNTLTVILLARILVALYNEYNGKSPDLYPAFDK